MTTRLNKLGSFRSNACETALRLSRATGLLAAWIAWVPIGGCSTTVVDQLGKGRQGNSNDIREAITEIGEKLYTMEQNGVPYDEEHLSAIEYLKEITERKADPLNRSQALYALGKLRRPDVGRLFVQSLPDSFWLVRFEAAKAISQNPHPEDAAPLIDGHANVPWQLSEQVGHDHNMTALQHPMHVEVKRPCPVLPTQTPRDAMRIERPSRTRPTVPTCVP